MRLRLAGLGLLCGVLIAACNAPGGGMTFDWERMIDQPKYKPNGESRFFPDGRANRQPPEGTRPVDALPSADGIASGLIDGVPVARIPIPVTRELLQAGRGHFEIYCAVCHGIAGDGESIVGRKMALRRPPTLHTTTVRSMPDGRIFQIATDGYGLMPSYAAELPPLDRWAVVAYLRALQLSQFAQLDSLPPAVGAAIRAEIGAVGSPSTSPGAPAPAGAAEGQGSAAPAAVAPQALPPTSGAGAGAPGTTGSGVAGTGATQPGVTEPGAVGPGGTAPRGTAPGGTTPAATGSGADAGVSR